MDLKKETGGRGQGIERQGVAAQGHSTTDGAEYCREIESYLCRKNDGHLIRIVGPSFERVCGWAARGVPLRVACRGIDRCFERYYAKGPRRRPVHIDFCEADVLDVFDEWRRALGVAAGDVGHGGGSNVDAASDVAEDDTDESVPGVPRRRDSLPAHLERVIARLTAVRTGAGGALDAALDDAIREIDAARGRAKGLRGDARAALLSRLGEIDVALLTAARAGVDDAARQSLRVEAESELAPFRSRMPVDSYERSVVLCADRLLRERMKLPVITLE